MFSFIFLYCCYYMYVCGGGGGNRPLFGYAVLFCDHFGKEERGGCFTFIVF